MKKSVALWILLYLALTAALCAAAFYAGIAGRGHLRLLGSLVMALFLALCVAAYAGLKKLCRFLLCLEELSAHAQGSGQKTDKSRISWREMHRMFSSTEDLLERLKSSLKQEHTAELLRTQAEIHALQSQINPHFLYNTLEIIRSRAIAQQEHDIADMTEALGTLFRYTISRPGEIATFAEEMEDVDNYLLIQNYRFHNKFCILKKYGEDVKSLERYLLPVLTIQPIIENAVHHGLEPKIGRGTITIRAFTTQDSFLINISDDGVGMGREQVNHLQKILDQGTDYIPEEKPHGQKSGIALINVNQRIKYYFGNRYGLRVMSTEQVGTTVEIVVPKISQTDDLPASGQFSKPA